MLLAGKVGCIAIAFLLLATGMSGPRSTPPPSGAQAGPDAPGITYPDNVITMQQSLHDKGHYRGKVDGVFGLRTRAGIRAYQKAENLPVTGQLDIQTAARLGITAEGRAENGHETPGVKPSAGVKWAHGSRRKRNLPRKTVTSNGTSTVPPV